MFTFPGTALASSITTSPYPAMLYSNSGSQDSNGLFYYLGTALGTTSWVNPTSNSQLNIYTSGTPGTGTVANLVDRDSPSTTQCISANTANNYFAFELPKYFTLTGYLLRNRTTAAGSLRTWSIQGSTVNFASTSSWTNIISYSSNTSLSTGSQYAYFSVGSNVKYKTFQLIQTGTNSSSTNALGLSEIELYGYLYDSL